MTPVELAQCWAPIPMRAKHVQAGDVIIGKDGNPWIVNQSAAEPDGRWSIAALRGPDTRTTARLDADYMVTVLVPVVERDAIELTHAELGARVVERRTTSEAA